MLKKIFKSKLNLKKETVTKLNKDQMNKIVGGVEAGIDTVGGGGGIVREKAKQDSIAAADSIA